MKSSLFAVIFSPVLLGSCERAAAPPPSEPARTGSVGALSEDAPDMDTGWVSLFAGRDLGAFEKLGEAEWNLVEDYVEADGYLRSYLVTKESYSNFELRVEFWPSADANSGVYIRNQNPEEIHAESGYEINIYDTNENPDNRTGAIINYSPPVTPTVAGEKWNRYEIVADGPHITVTLNGILVADLDDATYASGPIALQNNGGLIRFRNVQVRRLD